jgi:hypothetical protein
MGTLRRWASMSKPVNRRTRMTQKEYNGWFNYETWVVALWLDNEEGSQGYWQERAEETMRDCGNDTDEAINNLADELKEQHEEVNPVPDGTVFSDLMSAALSEVNWYEIAKHYVEEVEVETEEVEA